MPGPKRTALVTAAAATPAVAGPNWGVSDATILSVGAGTAGVATRNKEEDEVAAGGAAAATGGVSTAGADFAAAAGLAAASDRVAGVGAGTVGGRTRSKDEEEGAGEFRLSPSPDGGLGGAAFATRSGGRAAGGAVSAGTAGDGGGVGSFAARAWVGGATICG